MDIGTALLCVLNDLDDTCDRDEYEVWYQHEHLPERLSVPDFRHARRYRRLRGPGQEYLTFYETESPTALRSEAYRARLARPSDRTRRIMPHFRAMSRTACLVVADTGGGGIGGIAAIIGTDAAPSARATETLVDALQRASVTRARLWRADPEAAWPNPEAALRPGGDSSFDAILFVEGTDADQVAAAAAAAAERFGFAAPSTLYHLLFAVSSHSVPRQNEAS